VDLTYSRAGGVPGVSSPPTWRRFAVTRCADDAGNRKLGVAVFFCLNVGLLPSRLRATGPASLEINAVNPIEEDESQAGAEVVNVL
jgi:hypothetical protein